jgi:hypothetical protein
MEKGCGAIHGPFDCQELRLGHLKAEAKGTVASLKS